MSHNKLSSKPGFFSDGVEQRGLVETVGVVGASLALGGGEKEILTP